MEILVLPQLRAVTTQIDRILNAFYRIFVGFIAGGGEFSIINLITFILNNDYLLISLSLLIIGFVIGLIKRLISI